MKIFLDPGHGGADPGVVRDALVEKDLNLALCRLTRELLVKAGHDVAMARDADEALRLSERGSLSAQFSPDLVLSIHTNSNNSPGVRGLMAFYWPGNADGKKVSEAIASACPEGLRRRQAAYEATKEGWPRVRNVLTVHKATAVLVEVGFASNPQDNALLLDPKMQLEVAEAVAWGARCLRGDPTPVPKALSEAPLSASREEAPATPAEPEAPPEGQPSRRRRRS